MKKLLLLIIVAAIAVFAGSPFYKLYQLKQAYDNQDGRAIASAIDYGELSGNLKLQLSTKLNQTISQYPLIAHLAGGEIQQKGQTFINIAVDGAINEENLAATISTGGQQANSATKQLAAIWALAGNKIDLSSLVKGVLAQGGNVEKAFKSELETLMDEQAETLALQVQAGEDSASPDFSYCGINCFEVSGKVKGYPLTVEMQRKGLLDWKIVDIKLP